MKSNKIINLNVNFAVSELMSLVRENATDYFKRKYVISKVEDTKEF